MWTLLKPKQTLMPSEVILVNRKSTTFAAMVEEFARSYEAFPLVVATGGNAEDLFADDELVNRLIPDLELRGIAVAARLALAEATENEE